MMSTTLVHRHFLILGEIELDLHVLQYVIRYSTIIFSFDDALGTNKTILHCRAEK